jgi:L-amino acid N-acyltransferase YncA
MPVLNKMMRAGKAHWGYGEEGLNRFMEKFGIHDKAYFNHIVGYVAESPKGIAGYYLFNTNDNTPVLDQFILDTNLIGKGFGRHLWNHCVKESQKQGWSEFNFWSDPNSQGFYEHMGAIKVDERPMVTVPGKMSPIMKYSVPRVH